MLDIEVLDAKGAILTKDNEVRERKFKIRQKCQFQNISVGALPHKVLICSEEQVIKKLSARAHLKCILRPCFQFKLFSLPGLAACGKYKVKKIKVSKNFISIVKI